MDKNGTTFSEESLSKKKKKKKKKKRSFVFKQPTPLRQNDYGPTQPTQPARRRTRARARERERKRETTSFAVLVLPRFRKERKKASLSRDQITTISSESSFRLRNVGNISRDPVQKIIIIII